MPYVLNMQHRNVAFAFQKSQWSIPEADERACYDQAAANGWGDASSLWGIHLVQLQLEFLGHSTFPEPVALKIAKFVTDAGGIWHGYPVAHWQSPFDKPSETVLRAWMAAGYINRPKLARIHRGKPCKL